jgi:hypothetical protein
MPICLPEASNLINFNKPDNLSLRLRPRVLVEGATIDPPIREIQNKKARHAPGLFG